MASNLLDLPHEVLHSILANTDPQDLASLCCCRVLDDFIKNDRLLHKELYLKNFDEPQRDCEHAEPSWNTQLKELVNLQKILESSDAPFKSSKLRVIVKSVDYLLSTAASGSETSHNISFLTKLFESQQNVNTLLCGSMLFDWARTESWGRLSTARLRRDIELMRADLRTNGSPFRPADMDIIGSAVVTGDVPLEEKVLDQVPDTMSEDPTTHCESNSSLTEGDKSILRPKNQTHRLQRQLSAKLHCLYGVSIDIVRKGTADSPRYSLRSDSAPIHPYARSLVYDLRQHNDHTLWGPFSDTGSQDVDWEKVEAIMIILNHNMKLSTEAHHQYEGIMTVQDKHFLGASPMSFVSPSPDIPMEPSTLLEAQDPYNVTGCWMRVVCFLDYTELYSFNFDGESIPHDQPRHPINTDEAIRLITMEIRVTKIEPPGEDDGQRLPVVHFRGTSSSLRPSYDPNANSKIKGTVRLTPKGEVRWTTFSVYHGEERWRSEGIQVGGIQSSRGVLGYWFDKDHDEHGPAGPTAFWKSHDGIKEKKPPGRHSPMTQFTMPLY